MHTGEWPLIGRQAACEVVTEVLDRRPARSLVIAGQAGVGRSRLAREALSIAKNHARPVLWASATRTAALVPLGALAHLLPPVDARDDPLALLQRAIKRISGEGAGPPTVLGIDDVHLLDPLSVTLLHQLAATEAVTLVLTVRTGNADPDPATPLWKDGMATRLEVHPLTRPEFDGLASEVLVGDVETRTGERWWHLTKGNPLFFREILEDGLRSGRLHDRGGLWRWEGRVTPSQRLTEIVLAQLGELDPGQLQALEVLAAAEPLAVQRLVELSSFEAVSALERRGLLVDDGAGRPGDVRAAHPLYTEVMRHRLPEAALGHMRRRLITESPVPTSPELLPRWCALILDGGGEPDLSLLVEAARQAVRASDHPLAERLARSAVDRGAGVEGRLVLIESRYWQGDPVESDRLAREADAVAATEAERAAVTAARAVVLFLGRRREGDATALLDEASVALSSEESRDVLRAADALLTFLRGQPERAARLASTVLDRGGGIAPADALAAAAAACGLAVAGRTTPALEMVRRGWAALDTQPQSIQPTLARLALAQAEMTALHLSARLTELDRRAAELLHANLTAPEWPGDAVFSMNRGVAALAGGRANAAIRWLTEARGRFARSDPTGLRPLCHCMLAIARALIRDVDGALELLTEQDDDVPLLPAFAPYVHLARAFVAAVEGRVTDAGPHALAAGRLAAEQGQWGIEAQLLHSAVRFGLAGEVVERLRELGEQLDAPLVQHYAAHAQATVTGSGEGLDETSRLFEHAGAMLPAIDTAAESAAVYERQGNRRAAAAASARATTLARASGLAELPTIDVLPLPLLTAREEEVARLAAEGLSNFEIANRLVLSIRTVEAHLAHAYAKLGVAGRADLARTLQVGAPPSASRRRHQASADSLKPPIFS